MKDCWSWGSQVTRFFVSALIFDMQGCLCPHYLALFSTCMHVSSLMWLPRSRDTYEGPVSFPWFGPLYCNPGPTTTWIPQPGHKGEAAIVAQS